MRSIPFTLILATTIVGGCRDETDSKRTARPYQTNTLPVLCSADQTGQQRCNGRRIEACEDTGRWTTTQECDGDQVCTTEDGGVPNCAAPLSCSNGTQSGRCANGSFCTQDGQCYSNTCGPSLVCVPATCANNVQDEGETGRDCGGECPACFGEACSLNEHCITGYCAGGLCAQPACDDGVKNGQETGPDCGGECGGCPVGSECRVATDCLTGRCNNGQCAELPPDCSDGDKNGDETDVDCGGPTCGGCGLNRSCVENADCLSLFCNFGTCDRATCSDDIQNQGESDVDCGGANCPGCEDGRSCTGPGDCVSFRCDQGECGSCQDGVKNGGEVATDCGGPCAPCSDGLPCHDPDDCDSGRCESGLCTSCRDEIQNGNETDVDCGGPCDPCANGDACFRPQDCQSGTCEDNVCCTQNPCGYCGPTPTEICNGLDDDCDNQVDEESGIGLGDYCPLQDGVCWGARAQCRGSRGWRCDVAAYQEHDPDYEVTEESCDSLDNDCDGEIDGMYRLDSNDPCDRARCSYGLWWVADLPDGTFCGADYPDAQPQYEELYACDYYYGNTTCERAFATCHCSGGYCAVYAYNIMTGAMNTYSSSYCYCNGGTYGSLHWDSSYRECDYCYEIDEGATCFNYSY